MPEEDYIVKDGDCVSSIAFNHGFFWETLWNSGHNAELKSKRKDPNILQEGDVVHIPELTLKDESCATEKRHEFKLKGVPAKLKLRLMRPKKQEKKKSAASSSSGGSGGGLGGLGAALASVPGVPGGGGGGGDVNSKGADPDYVPPKNEEEPMANADYILEADGQRVGEGKADGDGYVTIPLIPNAQAGKLIVNKGKPDERAIALDLGGMDPVDEVTGVRKRLKNLGYVCQSEGPDDSPDLKTALTKFQERNSLEPTGKLDDTTRNKIKDLHGS
jgi:hypothetical protein